MQFISKMNSSSNVNLYANSYYGYGSVQILAYIETTEPTILDFEKKN
jgi:hypothetical protein